MAQVWIALCGAHSTGKSRALEEFLNRHGAHVHAIRGIMRKLIEEGYPVGDHAVPETLKAYVIKQFEAELGALQRDARIVISDRILIDGVAYVQANLALERTRKDWSQIDLNHFTAIAQRQCSWYHCIVHFPIQFPIVADGIRSLDEEYRAAVDHQLQQLLYRSCSCTHHYCFWKYYRPRRADRAVAYFMRYQSMTNHQVLFTDIDNTLFDWVDYFAPCFRAMLHALSRVTKQPEDALYEQFREVYTKVESIEFTWAIQELQLCRNLNQAEIDKIVHVGRVAFGRKLKRTLQPYPDVLHALRWLKKQRVSVVGVTNSFVADALYRLRRLGLEKYLSGLVGWDGAIESPLAPRRSARARAWEKRTSIPHVVALSRDHLKPHVDAYEVLLDVVAKSGTPEGVWVIGDSLTKDLVPARQIGAKTIWAKYGQDVDPSNFETLLRITHWSPAKIAQTYETTTFEPDFTVDQFSGVCEIIPAPQLHLSFSS